MLDKNFMLLTFIYIYSCAVSIYSLKISISSDEGLKAFLKNQFRKWLFFTKMNNTKWANRTETL